MVEDIWQTFEDSGDYLFNASHSAGYGTLSAITIYLKANHPQEFFWALLKNAKNEQKPLEEIQAIVEELPSFGIKILPPHILKSDLDFAMEGKDIRMGLGNVKNISEKNIVKLSQFRQEYPNKFTIFTAANEAKIPINILSSLILCGSMDEQITETRNKTFLEALLWGLLTPRERKYALKLGPDNKFKLINIVRLLKTHLDEDGKVVIKPSRVETLRRHFAPYNEIYEQNNINDKLNNYIHEKKLLGFSYSQRLIDLFQKECGNDLMPISEVKASLEGENCHFVGEVVSSKTWNSKEKHTPSLKVLIKDHGASLDCLAFNTERYLTIDSIRENNGGVLPKENDIVVVRGSKKGDCVFIRSLGVQPTVIFDKISQLKDFKIKAVVKETV
jgi:DNA polymerase III alpha subunit